MNSNVPMYIGTYQVLEKIGEGGMAKVYKAYDQKSDRLVAIKVMNVDKEITLQKEDRFLIEARSMAKNKHPNVIKIYDIGTQDNIIYIVMDYVVGQTLQETLKKSRFSCRKVLQIVKKISFAVEHIHQNGIIHRDLKPANIMIANDGNPIVMDFGLAKNIYGKSITQTGQILGTPRYMAPEQVAGNKEITAKVDVYALGTILYEMLTGTTAIRGRTSSKIMYNVMHNEIPDLQMKNPRLARELNTICLKALEKNVARRYQSVAALAQDIEHFLGGEAIAAHSGSFAYYYWKKIKKNKILFSIILTSLILFVVIAVVYQILWFQYRQKKIETYLGQLQKLPLAANISDSQSLEMYFNSITIYKKILSLNPYNKNVRTQLYKIQEKIGLWSLHKKQFLLSQLAFRQCSKLNNVRAQRLLKQLRQKRQELPKKQRKYIQDVMAKVIKSSLLLDVYVTKIVRMKEDYILGFLVPYLKSNNVNQRKLAIKAIGKLGNTRAKFNGKDSVAWLLARLKKLSPKKLPFEVENLIWALGALKDVRAYAAVTKARWKSGGPPSMLWKRTRIPFKWLPKKEGNEKLNDPALLRIRSRNKLSIDAKGAVADAQRAVELNPNDGRNYGCLGIALERVGDKLGAIKNHTKEIQLSPRNPHAHFQRASVRRSIGEIDAAIADCKIGLSLKPTNVWGSSILGGLLLYYKNDLDGAIKEYSRNISSKSPDLYRNLGVAYEKKGDLKQAILHYKATIKFNPRNAKAYYNLGMIHENKKNNLADAILNYSLAAKCRPREKAYRYRRAICHCKQGEAKRAIKTLKKISRFRPYKFRGWPDFKYKHYYWRAYAYFLLGSYKKACKYYKKSFARKKNSSCYLWLLLMQLLVNKENSSHLELFQDKSKLNKITWIASIVDMFHKKISPQKCISQVLAKNSQTSLTEKNMAYFFIGKFYLLCKKKTKAKIYLQKCVDAKEFASMEYYAAKMELARLK